jgi:macrocin-O-methyltransferase TylF-like protien
MGETILARLLMKLYYLVTIPFSLIILLHSRKIHPAYRLTWWKRFVFGIRVVRNKHSVRTGNSFKTALAMSMKLFELSPDVQGDVVECGTWKGGTAASLSLACKIVGRKLIVCDSFEGLPVGDPLDRCAAGYQPGDFCGTFDEVHRNITKYGDISRCEFVKGWFENTLPHLDRKIVLAFIDVDLEASMNTCMLDLWPLLDNDGYIFIDEYVDLDYCAIFYSERFWKEHFDRTPPGLIGAGTGLALGEFYIGPWEEREDHPMQHQTGAAYTRKSMSGYWAYYPQDAAG